MCGDGFDSLNGLKDKDMHGLTRIKVMSQIIDKAADAGIMGESDQGNRWGAIAWWSRDGF